VRSARWEGEACQSLRNIKHRESVQPVFMISYPVFLAHSPASGQVSGGRLGGGRGSAQGGHVPAWQRREPPECPDHAQDAEPEVPPAHRQSGRGQEGQHAVQAHSLQQPHGQCRQWMWLSQSATQPAFLFSCCCHCLLSPKVSIFDYPNKLLLGSLALLSLQKFF
jgi:hypothetical protein